MDRSRWRSAVATWGGAAWLVLQQFGVPAASRRLAREREVVLVQEASRALEAMERLPDGRVLTVPLAIGAEPDRQVGDDGRGGYPFHAN
jgi:hypothetical protein